MIEKKCTPAGDPFVAAAKKRREELAHLEERLAHELMDDDERQVLWDRVIRLRRRLSREGAL